MSDQYYMHLCADLARRAGRATTPNPTVGAVIVSNNTVIGSGYHRRAGTPHAEALAIASAGADAHGAALYVTLEPCCHHGRTPPCTEAIIRAGISRVVIGEPDPNPRVHNRGIARLQAAGITVQLMPPSDNIRSLNLPYRRCMTTGLPLITWKFASSIDGKIGRPGHRPLPLSSTQANTTVHRLRADHDAIITGVNTIITDDPQLTVRHTPAPYRQPRPIIFDSHARTPLTARIFSSPTGPIIITTDQADEHRVSALTDQGAHIITVPARNNRCDVLPALTAVASSGLQSALLETGGTLAASFLSVDAIDRILTIITPHIIGGCAPTPADTNIPSSIPITITAQQQLGPDCLITSYPDLQRSDSQCSPESWNEWDRSLACAALLAPSQ